jgi:hypothetical protein
MVRRILAILFLLHFPFATALARQNSYTAWTVRNGDVVTYHINGKFIWLRVSALKNPVIAKLEGKGAREISLKTEADGTELKFKGGQNIEKTVFETFCSLLKIAQPKMVDPPSKPTKPATHNSSHARGSPPRAFFIF